MYSTLKYIAKVSEVVLYPDDQDLLSQKFNSNIRYVVSDYCKRFVNNTLFIFYYFF